MLPPPPLKLSAEWKVDGTLTLSINDKPAGSASAGGLLAKTPNDGLQVGQDANDPVGDYAAPFKFDGAIARVTVRLAEPGSPSK